MLGASGQMCLSVTGEGVNTMAVGLAEEIYEAVAHAALSSSPPFTNSARRKHLPTLKSSRSSTPGSPPGGPETTFSNGPWQTWWGLDQPFVGNGGSFSELKEHNLGRSQGDGAVVDRDSVLRAGWTIEVPKTGARP